MMKTSEEAIKKIERRIESIKIDIKYKVAQKEDVFNTERATLVEILEFIKEGEE